MKQVFGYLNPLNYVRGEQRRGSQNQLFHIINIEHYEGDLAYQRDQVEEEPYDSKGSFTHSNSLLELKLNELEEVYLNHFDLLKDIQEGERNFVEYLVQADDTLQGIALKFNLNPKKVLEANSISEQMIVAGIKLRLPATLNIAPQLAHDPLAHHKSYLGRNLMDEIMLNGSTKKCTITTLPIVDNVTYLTEIGAIAGNLSINEDIILFDPMLSDYNARLTHKLGGAEHSISRLQACVAVKDVNRVVPIVLPTRMSEIGQQCLRDYIVQLVLHSLGRRRKSLTQTPSASIYFRVMFSFEGKVTEGSELQNEQHMYAQVTEICDTITQLVMQKREQSDQLEEEEKQLLLLDEDLTLVPFFDLGEDENVPMLIQRANEVWGGSSYIPKLLNESSTLTIDQFIQIVSHIPSVFKTGNWKMIYQNITHGSSLNTLLKASELNSPLILLIRDIDGSVFGAYLSDYLRMMPHQFFGAGETFLFCFRDSHIATYHWTTRNQDFIFCDPHGIGVGCGDKFGLFIAGDLASGYSSKCDTFDNDMLSNHPNFQIDILELWTLDVY